MRSLHSGSVTSVAGILAMLLSCAAMAAAQPTTRSTNSTTAAEHRHPDREVKIAVVQAGEQHSRGGNPGFEANFGCLAELARQAAKDRPDLIVFPEFAISGWP